MKGLVGAFSVIVITDARRVWPWLTQSGQGKILELDWYGLARKC